ncbi:MAG TPA: sensor domain-containing diguanylate cyclase [Vicinamibacteria bacterium]
MGAEDGKDRTPEELRLENEALRAQLEDFIFHLPDALVESDVRARQACYMNRMARLLFGYSAEDLAAGVPGEALFAPGEIERAWPILGIYVNDSLTSGKPYERTGKQELYEFRMRKKDGTEFVAETQSSFVLDEQGLPVRMRSIIRDVTKRKEMEKRLEEMGHRDALTGCYNRRHLEGQREELERPTSRWGCLVFDLDNFKAINDTYGHDEGDRVLRGFAHFLARHHRPDDLLVRTGGDEFALVVRSGSEAEAQAVARRLLEAAALDSPASFSMGVAYRRTGEALEQALARADRTMYAARGRRLRKPRRPAEVKDLGARSREDAS